MAKAVINLQKESGGIVKISPVDGTGVTELVVPESGNLVSVDAVVTDNAIARYDGATGKLQDSGVFIDDNSNVIAGGSSRTAFTLGVSRGIAIEPTAPTADSEFRVNGSGSWFTSFSSNASGAGYGGWRHIGSTGVIKNWVYTAGSGELQFGTNGTERMRIAATNGNLLVGTTTDNGVDKLQVNGSISSGTARYVSDLNTITSAGGFLTGGFTFSIAANGPCSYGTLHQIARGQTECTQMVQDMLSDNLFVRRYVNSAWTAWVTK